MNKNYKNIIINGIKTDYVIYTNGMVYSNKSKKYLKMRTNNKSENDYCYVTLYVNEKPYQCRVHRLVAEAFIPNPENKPEVNHKDGKKYHNDISNLEWVTTSENIIHAFKIGLKKAKVGQYSHFAKNKVDQVELACKLLEDGILTLYEISNVTGISFGMIYLIATKESWTNVSNKYNVENYYRDRKSYTYSMYETVFKLLHENKLSMYEISDISKVKYSSILNIRRYVKNPIYNDLFNEYDISVYTGGFKQYKEIPKKLKIDADILMKREIPKKYIKRILSKKYNINEEKIRVYLRDNYK